MSLNILFVYGNEPDPLTIRKAELLANSGFRVFLCYWHREDSPVSTPVSCSLPADHVYVIALPDPRGGVVRRLFLTLRFTAALRRVIRAVAPSVVHACHIDMLLATQLCRLDGGGFKLVFDLQDTNDMMLSSWMLLAQRASLRSTSLVFVTSPQFEAEFLRKYRLIPPDVQVHFVPNCPGSQVFQGLPAPESNEFTVGYIGTFRGEKSITWLVESVEALRHKGQNVSVLFAGTGEATPLVDALAAGREYIRNLGPYDYNASIRALYARVDLVFAVYDDSHNKRMALACRFSEAVLARRPLVVSADTYMAELVARDQLGYVVDPTRPATLAVAIDDACRLKRAGQSAIGQRREELIRDNSFESYIPVILSSYRQLTAGLPGAA